MPTYFCITVRFLQPEYHGRCDRDVPEWPPSPLRVFQSLIAASAARWNERVRLEYAVPALRWLERQPAPSIVAAVGEPSQVKYRLYVPDNVGDKVAGSWSRGGADSIANYRTEKDVRPTHLRHGDDAVFYLWPLADSSAEFETHREVLLAAARSITHLGWGVDMVVAEGSVISAEDSDKLPGERWRPWHDRTADGLRVPVEGTLNALIAKHDAFLNRLGPEGFNPVTPLTAFRVVGYRRATDPPQHPFTAFSLLRPDASGFRPFDTARGAMVVAGMLRHAAGSDHVIRALGWSPEKVAGLILGHGEAPGEPHRPVRGSRLAYIPLPSIEFRGEGKPHVVGSIRRALITVFGGPGNDELQQLTRLLSGTDLIGEATDDPVAMLSQIPSSDRTVRCYAKPSTTWATVTPVILPGYDDPRKLRRRLPTSDEGPRVDSQEQERLLARLDGRIDHLLRKAVRQAGYSDELARHAEIEWRKVGFWPRTEMATRYACPDTLRRFRRLHIRITWRDAIGEPVAIPGPICLGGGRFGGLGLFAAID